MKAVRFPRRGAASSSRIRRSGRRRRSCPTELPGTRTIALVGPGGAGKTSLAEALLFAAGAIDRQGIGRRRHQRRRFEPRGPRPRRLDRAQPDAFRLLGDRFALIDSPGSVGFAADGALGAAAADLAIVVVDPDPDRALLAEPTLRQLESLGIPHIIFVNKIDQARGSIQDLLEALQPMSASPLIARQIPIREGEKITGFVDLALERGLLLPPGKPSEQNDIPADLADREARERIHMLEQLADHDDALLEQLLMDEIPDRADGLRRPRQGDRRRARSCRCCSARRLNGFGVRRLMKALRHEAPAPRGGRAARRHAAAAPSFSRYRTAARWAGCLARVFGGTLKEGGELKASGGDMVRVGTLFAMQGEKTVKLAKAAAGDVVAGPGLGELRRSSALDREQGAGADRACRRGP